MSKTGIIELNSFTQLPLWLRKISSDYLHNGHRAPTSSYLMCLKSLFMLHTETINIWTHLIPCFVFIALMAQTFTSNLGQSDKLVFGLFLLGAFLCHVFSTAFHTFLCHSEDVCKFFQKLDYCGIALLITASFVPWLHYGFYFEEPLYARTYLACIMAMAILCMWFALDDKYGATEYRPFRAFGFAMFGLFGVVPGLHWLALHQEEFWINMNLMLSFCSLVGMGVLYIIGAALYASRIPERYFPGKCDLFLHSHQIFHVLVTVAALVHYNGLNLLLDHINQRSLVKQ